MFSLCPIENEDTTGLVFGVQFNLLGGKDGKPTNRSGIHALSPKAENVRNYPSTQYSRRWSLWDPEFYKDYMNMKEKIESYVASDLSAIYEELAVAETKLDETLEYTKDIKNGLRDDIVRLERIVDAVEDDVNKVEDNVRTQIDLADQRFENKRDQLLTDYEQKADSLRTSTDIKIKEVEERLNKKLQRALDNL